MALLSRAASPAETVGPFVDDRRRLGVAVERLVLWNGLDDLAIGAEALALPGRHEPGWGVCWTDRHAALAPGGARTLLDVHLAATMTCPIEADGPERPALAA